MSDRKKVIDIYVGGFSQYVNVQRLKNPSFYPTQNSILEYIEQTNKIYSALDLDEIDLSKDEKKEVVNSIEAIYAIYQEEGSALLGDYDHNYEWYKELLNSQEYQEYYWPRYKEYLKNYKHFSPNIIDRLENTTLKDLMSYLGNPNEDAEFAIRGLVVGDVQSGKTSNYLGLITKAADAGYKVIFILTGTIESLRKQTQQRIEEGFVGYDSVEGKYVGVGGSERMPKAFTSRAKDFTASDNQNTTYKISDWSALPMIFVVKKNVSVLQKIHSSLRKINTTPTNPKINYPMLMIDDEADNASVNTAKPNNDPTKINKYIRSILSLFTKTSYVGFTATPFANVFIDYYSDDEMLGNDLFPRDFIYSLETPSNYCGARKYFFSSNTNVRIIEDANANIFSMDHKKEWNCSRLFDSVYHAINTFLIANAIRDLRIDKNTHRSMLINMSRFTKVQGVIKDIVEEYFKHVKSAVKQTHKLNRDYALTNPYIKSLKNSYEKEYSEINVLWDDIFDHLYDAIKEIKIIIVNSSRQSEKLNYDDYKNGLRVIAIGGLALSRGLTLEGLMCSYFYRNTATFDVLMQMGRWFGYRDGYDDLCRIYMREKSVQYYKEIYEDIECLKADIRTMGKQNKKPKDYGIRVRNKSIELKITASNKMRNTKNKIVLKSYYGNIFETPYLYRDLSIIQSNIESTEDFMRNHIKLSDKDETVTHPYFRNISKEYIIDLLQKIKIHPANENVFDLGQLIPFIQKENHYLDKFDVLILGGSGGKNHDKRYEFKNLGIDIKRVSRKFDVHSKGLEKVIRINGVRAHLWGRSDTRFGLNSEELKFIEENAIDKDKLRAQSYLDLTGSNFKARNPLLIIYFVDLDYDQNDKEFQEMSEDEKVEIKLCYYDLQCSSRQYAVGYAVGFPKIDGVDASAVSYTVNITANYFENEHEENYEGEEDNE